MTIIVRRCRIPAPYNSTYIRRGFGDAGQPSDEGVGEYLAHFDPEADGGGQLTLTPDPLVALRFVAANEAMTFLQQVSKSQPRREDGRPNRPLTDLGWEFRMLDLQSSEDRDVSEASKESKS